jgi:hypothetical protein
MYCSCCDLRSYLPACVCVPSPRRPTPLHGPPRGRGRDHAHHAAQSRGRRDKPRSSWQPHVTWRQLWNSARHPPPATRRMSKCWRSTSNRGGAGPSVFCFRCLEVDFTTLVCHRDGMLDRGRKKIGAYCIHHASLHICHRYLSCVQSHDPMVRLGEFLAASACFGRCMTLGLSHHCFSSSITCCWIVRLDT